eukprot:TRINITY_DN3096_c0_g1_i1.p1 TRINITY_DN3096_c0_g1~~TRINITY_DN3096_c0_g1_i1.p1  ORF type:complete len:436 (-),score=93.91 TRINITY_DN3096_c0_g1_i1:77-1384(-)
MAASPSPTRASLERNMRAAIAQASRPASVTIPDSPSGATGPVSPRSPPLSPSSKTPRNKPHNKPSIAPTEGREYVSNAREELAHGLSWLFKSQKFLDTLIIVGTAPHREEFRVHGIVLAACSDPFKAMLSGGYQETFERVIRLPSHHPKIVKKMIEFIYTGEVELTDDIVVDLFTLADQFQIVELKRVCEEHVAVGVSLKSVLVLLCSAKNHTAEQLMGKCVEFFKKNAADVFEQDGFLQLPEDVLVDLLKTDFRLQETKVFNAVVRWGEYQVKKSGGSKTLKQALNQVIRQVRFVSIKKDFLRKVVLPLDVLPKEILIDVLMDRIKDPTEDKEEDSKDENGNVKILKPWMKSRGRMFKSMADFPSENEYAEYLKAILTQGMLLRAVRTYENVMAGDIGTFVQYNTGIPPCQVNWRGYGNTYWLYWRDLELIDEE